MNILEQFRHILMGNIFVFMKIKLWIKQEVNRWHGKIWECKYTNQMNCKIVFLCSRLHAHTVCVCYKSLGTCYTHAYKCAINFFRPVYGPFKSDVTTKKPF